MSSVHGVLAATNSVAYETVKTAIIGMTKQIATDVGKYGITCNCICPGLIKTKLSEALWSKPEVEKATTAMKALGRMGTTDEIVGAAIYFASDASSFTTGSILTVDGGM